MKLLDFIQTHKQDWEALLSQPPYSLMIKKGEGELEGLVLFKYNQIGSDFNEELVKEARGIIFDMYDNWKIVRYAFNKFFNYGESYAAEIDWKTARVQEKLDGSLISVWYWPRKGKWMVSTSGNIDAHFAEVYDKTESPIAINRSTFGDMFDSVFSDYSKLDRNCTYTFELVDTATHVIRYDKVDVWHIGTRDNTTLEELNVNIGVQKPKEYPLHNLDAVLKAAETLNNNDKIEHEGFVVVDNAWNRIKVKNSLYLAGHYMMGNTVSFKRCIDIIAMNEEMEFLSYFPQHKKFFEDVKSIVDDICNELEIEAEDIFSRYKNLPRKDFISKLVLYPKTITSYVFAREKYNGITARQYLFGGYKFVGKNGTEKETRGWSGIYDLVKSQYVRRFDRSDKST